MNFTRKSEKTLLTVVMVLLCALAACWYCAAHAAGASATSVSLAVRSELSDAEQTLLADSSNVNASSTVLAVDFIGNLTGTDRVAGIATQFYFNNSDFDPVIVDGDCFALGDSAFLAITSFDSTNSSILVTIGRSSYLAKSGLFCTLYFVKENNNRNYGPITDYSVLAFGDDHGNDYVGDITQNQTVTVTLDIFGYGDVNNDGSATVLDAVQIMNKGSKTVVYVNSHLNTTYPNIIAGEQLDVDGDGDIDDDDALLIQQYYAIVIVNGTYNGIIGTPYTYTYTL